MLDPKITRHVETALQLKSSEFDRAIRSRIAEAGRGADRGNSRTILRYGQEFSAELDRRALYVFDEIKRALQLHPQQLDETLGNWLGGLHFTETRKQCTELQRFVGERFDTPAVQAFGPSPAPRLSGPLNEQCNRLGEKYAFEISNHLHELRQAQQRPPGAAPVTIHATHIGAVQTGPNATAQVTMNVGGSDREALLAALEMAAGALRNAHELADAQRAQLLDVIAQARTTAQQPAANPSMLRGMFLVLCEALQTLAAARPAMDALRAAALPFGITL